MTISRTDRIASLLERDESLIDVLAGISPAFERLRRPAMRKVMARLVTVEQAARMAGLDPDELVARLNRAGDPASGDGERAHVRVPSSAEEPRPPALLAVARDRVVEVDVREDLRAGREPFSRIMAARREVPEGGALCLRAIFEPVPLYAVMRKQGFEHHAEQLGDEDWRVWFFPAGTGAETNPEGARDADDPDVGQDVIVLDVRDLEPPEPMVRTLAALETLPAGATLLQINARVPRFLLPRLEERGFAYEIREQSPDLVRVFIRRAREAPVHDSTSKE